MENEYVSELTFPRAFPNFIPRLSLVPALQR